MTFSNLNLTVGYFLEAGARDQRPIGPALALLTLLSAWKSQRS
jgi:hypothetical protein